MLNDTSVSRARLRYSMDSSISRGRPSSYTILYSAGLLQQVQDLLLKWVCVASSLALHVVIPVSRRVLPPVKEYALADFRWAVADPTVVSLEILTVLGAGPLALYIASLLARDDPARHYWIIVLSTAELYGG